ncbi:uncharacterized protein A4U43_C02F1340 [Asparagus officinalis]|uniref:Uncharacterized protein n=1 Tax=Asparagus officinalis TaxID=4686 RepID=A0A5P1FEY9_ASPOF|nr:uncharacterized protein A4U43_C02F1340 [Asparagus officinalis]
MLEINAALESLWVELSNFISKIESSSEPRSALATMVGTSTFTSILDTLHLSGNQRSPVVSSKVDKKNVAFLKFSEKHRKLLNAFIRCNSRLLEKSFFSPQWESKASAGSSSLSGENFGEKSLNSGRLAQPTSDESPQNLKGLQGNGISRCPVLFRQGCLAFHHNGK